MSDHPRSKRGLAIEEEKLRDDIIETFMQEGAIGHRMYDDYGEYNGLAVKNRYGSFGEALDELGLPSKSDIRLILEDVEQIRDKHGEVDELLYEEEGRFDPAIARYALQMSWDEINRASRP